MFYSPKPRSQVRILIYRNWAIPPKDPIASRFRRELTIASLYGIKKGRHWILWGEFIWLDSLERSAGLHHSSSLSWGIITIIYEEEYIEAKCERKDVTFLTGRQPREFQVSFGRAK